MILLVFSGFHEFLEGLRNLLIDALDLHIPVVVAEVVVTEVPL
jgi:hypothetical protein